MRPIFLRPPLRRLSVTAVLVAALLSCGQKESRQPSPLSSDELYLVEAYISVRRAGSLHTFQRDIAERLLDSLATEVDTLRVARTISALNATPERWSMVFQTIEDRLSGRDSTGTSEPAGD
ncbi:MAG: hypothetical protein OEX18_02870 [Candidatus Krumholzibacteria bacterium]|nr:hypothetical protein [Candidatus Krumholzibacteria bacterium]MDH4336200.1 hypothetical protein [Candidatus Krumholzibacteria bacterium]MDH5268841.1 hypothetical protein [Candidatus Krumholzibacteria bacterium]